MRKGIAIAAATAVLLCPFPAVSMDNHTAWSYSGSHGPTHWGSLRPEYRPCYGEQQSPIDIREKILIEADLGKIKFGWSDSKSSIENNGHTIQVNLEDGGFIKVDKQKYDLVQYHFHVPSEHAIDSKLFDMEAHFVHKSLNGELTVIAVFFKEGKENPKLNPIWENMSPAGQFRDFAKDKIKAADLLPEDQKNYFHYKGSLTTPPCSEVVNWYVFAEPLEISKAQLKAFTKLLPTNNRPIQPLNRRLILKND